jgi:hypothetical protein
MLSHSVDIQLTDSSEVVSLTCWPAALYLPEYCWYSFLLEAESTPGPKCVGVSSEGYGLSFLNKVLLLVHAPCKISILSEEWWTLCDEELCHLYSSGNLLGL